MKIPLPPLKIHTWDPLKKPNKKRKRSLRRKTKEDADDDNSSAFDRLSADLITSICIRCPVNALAMLRCTSKSWHDFFISPFFLHSHMEQSTENAQLLFLKPINSSLPQVKRVELQFVSLDMNGYGITNELYSVSVPHFEQSFSGLLCSAGLVCLPSGRDIYLCNPVLQQLCKLPKCSPHSFLVNASFGFGYLHSTKEHKVVRFFYKGPAGGHLRCQVQQKPTQWNPTLWGLDLKCEVFTLNRTGAISNSWKEIVETLPPCHPKGAGLLVNQCLYWLAKRIPFRYPDQVLSFDLETEKFLSISCPSGFTPKALMDLKGMLCVPDYHEGRVLDLWILKDNISCIWVKEYSINLVVGIELPINILPFFGTWNDEIIFITSRMIVFYDLKRKRFRARIKLSDIGFTNHCILREYGFAIYRKSLFSLY